VPHTQERIELLARATTHGMHFNVTGGATLSTHDHFKSVEFRAREVTKKKLDIIKKIRLAFFRSFIRYCDGSDLPCRLASFLFIAIVQLL
jgi:hypothetical protein